MSSQLLELNAWIHTYASLTEADQVHWCDGSDEENARLVKMMLDTGDLIALNPRSHPNCFLHRSSPSDVARVEHLTFVCSKNRDDAGSNNHWMDPDQAKAKMDGLYKGCMKGRTLYVVPYCMGPIDSPLARCGVEITDSPYVVINMRLMTRMGAAALARIEREGTFVKGVHSTGDLNPDRRFIMHFPEELGIQSFGYGYGGNALLGKKCHALRIASWQARKEGWLAEHMLILGVENPQGDTHYIAAAFPSACGKTNLAMLIPPEGYRDDGWKIWTVGDDICWMRSGADGRLYAINPEAGYFGVVPGTSTKTNPNALAMLNDSAIFTNVAVTADNQPWWEGLPDGVPVKDWQGRDVDPANGPAAHPNSRFTVSATRCPSYTAKAEDPRGVPLSAIVFGGRRESLVPLVFEARDWKHGVLVGAGMASETTAAATGAVGEVRRDSMAMKPFAGYNFGDYFAHWLSFDVAGAQLPKIFHVNWFRKSAAGKFLWPGFGDNMRVLEWMLKRVEGKVAGRATAIGTLPQAGELNRNGLAVSDADLETLLAVDTPAWRTEVGAIADYLEEFGERTPQALFDELEKTAEALA